MRMNAENPDEPLRFQGDFAPEVIIKRALINAKLPKSELAWVAMRQIFAFGSTNSIRLCKAAGINPHSELQDIHW